jgi:hypothetical protein
MIHDRDELRHRPSPELAFSESKWFSFYDQSLNLWVSCRMGLEANRGKANRWVVVAFEGKVVYHDLSTNLDLPPCDWTDITINALQFQTLKTMSCYKVRFENADVSFDITWNAETPVFDYADCKVPIPPSLAAEHYEQSGIVAGSFLYQGVLHAVVGYGHRDHSWGVRHWEGFRGWVAFMARFGMGSYLHLEEFNEESGGLTRHGFIYHDGRNVPIRDANIALEIPEGKEFPASFRIMIYDVNGGRYSFSGWLLLTSLIVFGRCQVGESYGIYRDAEGRETLGVIEYGFTSA